MFLLNWLREYRQIKDEFKDEKFCSSCETLKMQLAIANQEKRDLLNRLLDEPAEAPVDDTVELKPVLTRVPFNAIRQRLEADDRRRAEQIKADFLKGATTPIKAEIKTDVDKLEEELINARTEREARTS